MKSLSYLNKYFIRYKWLLFLGIIFLIGANLFNVIIPLIVSDAVDDMEQSISGDNWMHVAFYLGGMYILFSLIKGVFVFFQRQTIIKMSRHIEFDLKNEIYTQYQRLNYNFYKANATGDLMNRISEDVSKVRMYLGPGVMYTINLVFLFIFVIYSMMKINVELTLYALTPLPLMSFMVYKVSSRMNRQSEQVQRSQSEISTIVQETFSGIAVLKTYAGEPKAKSKFNLASNQYLQRNMNLVITNSLFMPTITFLIGLSTIITIYVGGLLSYEAQSTVTNGNIVAFVIYVNMLTWPFASVGWVTSLVQRAAASQERINEFLKASPEIVNPSDEPFNFQGSIRFENVSYRFPNSGIQAIENLSFEIKPGETLAILGRTGSGKSTIIHLLLRQFDPDEGMIYIDEAPLNNINLSAFRNQTGVVPQEVFLFSDTIENNVKFGVAENESANRVQVEEALIKAHVYHNVTNFKKGLDTILGERGVNISGGQKQRVSIARALIRNPKLLILDDCLSAVDTETEETILNNLKNQIDKNTSLIVSHRVSSIRHADRIIVLDNGKKIEEGKHDELLALGGVYADVYNKQLLEEQKKKSL
ncbi:MAG: ABC transporter ATP-binding protein [Crocinitomicaceae bacterium]|nr:ABC transporter ATP-binding protein [Crocinitomicaceae bacterium]